MPENQGSKGKPSKAGKRKGKFPGIFGKMKDRKLNRVMMENGSKALAELKDFYFNKATNRSQAKQLNFSKGFNKNNKRFNNRRQEFGRTNNQGELVL